MGWPGPVLTDSGGYQIFSLPGDRTLTEEGARFLSYVDGRPHLLSPERSIEVQTAIGSDIMMVLDECMPSTAEPAVDPRGHGSHPPLGPAQPGAPRREGAALFAIVQGGLDPELRRESADFLTAHPFDGFAIGGLAVGDTRAQREEMTAHTAALLPADRPRYLMGVGTPPDLLAAIGLGVDMFDCVLPTHLAWQGTAFTATGRVRISRGAHRSDDEPLDADLRLQHLSRLHPRLPAPPGEVQRAAGAAAAVHPQPAPLPHADARGAGRHRGRGLRPLRPAEAGGDRSPRARRRERRGSGVSHEVVRTRRGDLAIRCREVGEVMHPGVGPLAEARHCT